MILITGATGMVGAHLLVALLKEHKAVRAIYRTEAKVQQLAQSSLFKGQEALFKNIEWVQADITDVPSLESAFEGITEVYHCAGFISFNPKDYHALRAINIEGTANIVNFSIAHKIEKLCYVSSVATLGAPDKEGLVTEKCFWNPDEDHHVYGITKYGAEMEVWRASQEGIPVVIVNPGVIFGDGVYSKSMDVFKEVKNGIPFYAAGGSGFVDVADVVSAMLQLMKSDLQNERYILVSENLGYRNLLKTVAQSIGVKEPNKKVPKPILYVVRFFDWIKSLFTGGSRTFTKHTVASLVEHTEYDASKIKKAIDFKFQPMASVIKKYAVMYKS